MKKKIIFYTVLFLMLSCNIAIVDIRAKELSFIAKFNEADEKYIYDKYGKKVDRQITIPLSTKCYEKYLNKGYTFIFASTSKRISEQCIKRYWYSGVDQENGGSIRCYWMVSFLCRFSYNANTGKVSYVPEPILELVSTEFTHFSNIKGRLDSQSVSIDDINYSSVDFSCSFRIIGRRAGDTLYFDRHYFSERLKIS